MYIEKKETGVKEIAQSENGQYVLILEQDRFSINLIINCLQHA